MASRLMITKSQLPSAPATSDDPAKCEVWRSPEPIELYVLFFFAIYQAVATLLSTKPLYLNTEGFYLVAA